LLNFLFLLGDAGGGGGDFFIFADVAYVA